VQVAGEVTQEQLQVIGNAFHEAFQVDGTVTTQENISAALIDSTVPVEGVNIQATLTVQNLAQVAHNVNSAYCAAIGDPVPAVWEEADEAIRLSAINGVLFALRFNPTPEQQHMQWVKGKLMDGWKYGPVKDAEKKEHPCLVTYEALPEAQRVKDYLFQSVVRSLRGKLATPKLNTVVNVEKLTDEGTETVNFLTLSTGDKFETNGTTYVVTAPPYINYAKPIPVWSVDADVIDATPPDAVPPSNVWTDEELAEENSTEVAPPFEFPKATDFEGAVEKSDAEQTGTPEQGI
jgi:hypothetical protein